MCCAWWACDGRPVVGIDVRGGVGGIEAEYDDMVRAARAFGEAATHTSAVASHVGARELDLGTAVTAALDPVGAAQSQWALAEVEVDLIRLSFECTAVDVELRAAAAAYLGADRLEDAVAPIAHGLARLPRDLALSVGVAIATRSAARGVNTLLTTDPDALDILVDGLGGVRGSIADDLRNDMTDGRPSVRDVRVEPESAPPRSVRDLITGLAARNDGADGEIDVRVLTRPDGRRAVIVDIPGTKSWSMRPTHDITSMSTNVRAIRGESTSYQLGIQEAMRRAGVRPGDDVMLVGHSEGGMIAANIARDAYRSGEFHVTHVITAGAPLGAIAADVPREVRVLALENRNDCVPATDGVRNPDRVNVTTVTVDHQHHDIVANHELRDSYLAGAADVDGSDNASIREVLDSAHPFFDGSWGTTHVFQITRELR